MKKLLALLVLSIILISCNTTPQPSVWTPLRVNSGVPKALELREPTSFSFRMDGPWSDENRIPLDERITERLEEQLYRRGFILVDENATNRIDVSVVSNREERHVVVSQSNVGVSNTASRTVFVYEMRINGYVGERLIWNSYSTWITQTANPEASVVTAAIQSFSQLDSSDSVIPVVPELKETHVANYIEAHVQGQEFSCPALPSVILVLSEIGSANYNNTIRRDGDRPNSRNAIRDDTPYESWTYQLRKFSPPTALPAYVDLMRTAEFAIPVGASRSTSPISVKNWRSVELGGTYLIGPDERRINVIVRLSGNPLFYELSEAKIASDEEWNEFLEQKEEWLIRREEFFDMYVE